ncbi:MAG: Nif3-like dinuclear metal center hexameric protein [Bacillota bacterium]|nr:Nif3-like dinuclear metal center hexameric protein [Bacillota bacterium]
MFVNSKKIANIIEEIAPLNTALQWDNVGFQIGNENVEINRIMIALEVTDEVLNEAISNNIDLIITHHPLIFKSIYSVVTDNPIQKLIIRMIKNNINLYVAHTNIDVSKNGTNYYLSKLLDLNRVEGLDTIMVSQLYKISVFAPENAYELVKQSLLKYNVGEYKNRGRLASVSNSDKSENNEEVKIEMIIDNENLNLAIENMLRVHPYDVVPYDVIKLENISKKHSIGVIGYLEKDMEIDELVNFVKEKFEINKLRFVKSNNKRNRKIAICSGAGSEYIEKASKLGCKCLITGDVKYHEAQLARQLNINVIDAGHFETENIYVQYLAEFIKRRCYEKGYDVNIMESENIINPFEYK